MYYDDDGSELHKVMSYTRNVKVSFHTRAALAHLQNDLMKTPEHCI